MSAPSKSEIHAWLLEAQARNATHVLIVCDTFDHSDAPVSVMPGEDVRKIYDENNNQQEMSRVMEVYHLGMNLEAQLAEGRAFHFDLEPPAVDPTTVPAPAVRKECGPTPQQRARHRPYDAHARFLLPALAPADDPGDAANIQAERERHTFRLGLRVAPRAPQSVHAPRFDVELDLGDMYTAASFTTEMPPSLFAEKLGEIVKFASVQTARMLTNQIAAVITTGLTRRELEALLVREPAIFPPELITVIRGYWRQLDGQTPDAPPPA